METAPSRGLNTTDYEGHPSGQQKDPIAWQTYTLGKANCLLVKTYVYMVSTCICKQTSTHTSIPLGYANTKHENKFKYKIFQIDKKKGGLTSLTNADPNRTIKK